VEPTVSWQEDRNRLCWGQKVQQEAKLRLGTPGSEVLLSW
jgi:hypothetical protein